MRMLLVLLAVLHAAAASAQTTKTFAWDAAAGAETYTLQIGSAPGQTLREAPVGNVTMATLTFDPGTYYVRVRAVNTTGPSGPSNEVMFSIAAPIDPCVASPLQVTVTSWPTGKKTTVRYTANFPVSYTVLLDSRDRVTGAVFTETSRTCPSLTIRR